MSILYTGAIGLYWQCVQIVAYRPTINIRIFYIMQHEKLVRFSVRYWFYEKGAHVCARFYHNCKMIRLITRHVASFWSIIEIAYFEYAQKLGSEFRPHICIIKRWLMFADNAAFSWKLDHLKIFSHLAINGLGVGEAIDQTLDCLQNFSKLCARLWWTSPGLTSLTITQHWP